MSSSLFLSQPAIVTAPSASEAAAAILTSLRMIDPFSLEPLGALRTCRAAQHQCRAAHGRPNSQRTRPWWRARAAFPQNLKPDRPRELGAAIGTELSACGPPVGV